MPELHIYRVWLFVVIERHRSGHVAVESKDLVCFLNFASLMLIEGEQGETQAQH